MTFFAGVLMRVDFAVFMHMGVGMGFIFNGAVNPPDTIGEAENNQQLRREISTSGLEPFQFSEGNTQCRADQTEGNGADHMP